MTPAPYRQQILRFALVGAAGFLVDAAVLYAVADRAGWYAGRLLSFWAAASLTWLLNRRFTFASARGPAAAEYGRYLLAMLGGAAVNYAVYVAMLQSPLAPIFAVAAGSIAGMAVNYTSARKLVFRDRIKKP
ncbi:GtrA family protein [Xylophilus sp. GOD-11R]|uniref:GtrA family protein n=1 Tax=Xylophilus sp. GOD-11R TaxID=3089814 RepID=UPI00298D4004|nr:GtrA family protein [Xylophilus sp. GOD-11R]WPB56349.1 GtrA family protein [Xylophilus sp. GOD-11R]